MRRLRTTALILVLVATPLFAGATDWTLRSEKASDQHQVSLWQRPVHGSTYPEYRMELQLQASPDEVIGALESNLVDPRTWPKSYRRTLLRTDPNLLISHDTILVPFLADRDVVLRIEMARDASTGVYRMTWRADADAGPPPANGVVRMPRSDGFWTVQPDGRGGTRVIYQSFVEFTGRIPASLVASNAESSILEQAQWLRRTINERRVANKR